MEPFNTKAIASPDQKIKIEEIEESIKYFKTKKAPGLNNITNEMIKYSDRDMTEHLQTLFDDIMESGYYPTCWNQRLISSIYKLSKNDDQNNYYNLPGKLLRNFYIIDDKINFKKV